MPFLVATVVVLAVVLLLNLLITFAILRRLRGYEERLAEPQSAPRNELVGRRLPEFTATSTGGENVDRAAIVGRTRLVAFFSSSCDACREQATRFARHKDSGRVAFVVMDSPEEADRAAILAALDGAPTVISEPVSGDLAAEFGVRTYPQLVELDSDGVAVNARHSLTALALAH